MTATDVAKLNIATCGKCGRRLRTPYRKRCDECIEKAVDKAQTKKEGNTTSLQPNVSLNAS